MTAIHKEISFEDEICAHLAAHGWHYAEGDAAGYDRGRALFPADVLAWVQAAHPGVGRRWRRTTAARRERCCWTGWRTRSRSGARWTCCATGSS
ncbi:MAG: hypothetical protein R3F11_31165 [Verrucomicrobiales bacterium]